MVELLLKEINAAANNNINSAVISIAQSYYTKPKTFISLMNTGTDEELFLALLKFDVKEFLNEFYNTENELRNTYYLIYFINRNESPNAGFIGYLIKKSELLNFQIKCPRYTMEEK